MRGTDYDFPPEWESFTDEEKSDWFTEERCRRQAMRQNTGFAKRVEQEEERLRLRDRFRKFVRLGK
ncbi:hypothetical protein M1M38_gp050 [Halorubrum tailed virus 27]|uniref:Uncharacterized protein n=1 Tax=Halorubrum tailed virus 27 TaxID=2878008 RepID=A0AAE9BYY9_9CAUD|nr:hypothetical protein M1M38_gp050 [Halorubrum tailed virus 27]UBF22743.1 hypothetical protein HRTV-27_gp50 [Halorubrum tailed virus 27]